MSNVAIFKEINRERHAVRAFLPDIVDEKLIASALDDAQRAPSNCNTQPWIVHLVSGAKRDELSAALIYAYKFGKFSMDFSFDQKDYGWPFQDRCQAQAAVYHQALGVRREDYDERATVAGRNLTFFGAPHVALLFIPEIGDSVRVAADVGMYAQTFLLSLVAHGLGGVPQTMLGMFAQTARDVLGVDNQLKLLFGISFGYPDLSNPANSFRMDRVSLDQSVEFHC